MSEHRWTSESPDEGETERSVTTPFDEPPLNEPEGDDAEHNHHNSAHEAVTERVIDVESEVTMTSAASSLFKGMTSSFGNISLSKFRARFKPKTEDDETSPIPLDGEALPEPKVKPSRTDGFSLVERLQATYKKLPFSKLKRETRVGVAAMLSFALIVVAMVYNRPKSSPSPSTLLALKNPDAATKGKASEGDATEGELKATKRPRNDKLAPEPPPATPENEPAGTKPEGLLLAMGPDDKSKTPPAADLPEIVQTSSSDAPPPSVPAKPEPPKSDTPKPDAGKEEPPKPDAGLPPLDEKAVPSKPDKAADLPPMPTGNPPKPEAKKEDGNKPPEPVKPADSPPLDAGKPAEPPKPEPVKTEPPKPVTPPAEAPKAEVPKAGVTGMPIDLKADLPKIDAPPPAIEPLVGKPAEASTPPTIPTTPEAAKPTPAAAPATPAPKPVETPKPVEAKPAASAPVVPAPSVSKSIVPVPVPVPVPLPVSSSNPAKPTTPDKEPTTPPTITPPGPGDVAPTPPPAASTTSEPPIASPVPSNEPKTLISTPGSSAPIEPAPPVAEETPKFAPAPDASSVPSLSPGTIESTPAPVASPFSEPTRSPVSTGPVIPNLGKRRPVDADLDESLAKPKVADAPMPKEMPGVRDKADPIVHTVEPNENFWTISKLYYSSGRYYKALHHANRRLVPDIRELYVGTSIKVPDLQDLDPTLIDPPTRKTTTARSAQPAEAPRTASRDRGNGIELGVPTVGRGRKREPVENVEDTSLPSYRVRSNDTLRSIARDTLGDSRRYKEILELNRDLIRDPSHLTIGQSISLPEDATVGRRAMR
jgi:hypothetical protein